MDGPTVLFAFDPATAEDFAAWNGDPGDLAMPYEDAGTATALTGGELVMTSPGDYAGTFLRHQFAESAPLSGVVSLRAAGLRLAGIDWSPDPLGTVLTLVLVDDAANHATRLYLLPDGQAHLVLSDALGGLAATADFALASGSAGTVELVQDTSVSPAEARCYRDGVLLATASRVGLTPRAVVGVEVGCQPNSEDEFSPDDADLRYGAITVANGVQGV